MSKKLFTDEEIAILRQNPFTFKVNRNTLSFTKEFKELFLAEYNAGNLPRQILIDHGYDPEILGNRRIWGIPAHIREQYDRFGELREGPPNTKPRKPKTLSDKDEIIRLRHEVDYMRQEIEFLKKISSIRNTGK